MTTAGNQRALPGAFGVAAALWLPLLALDLGYPSLTQHFTTSVLLRQAGWSLALCLAVVAALALAAGLVARLAAAPGQAAAGAFCGVLTSSAAFVVLVLVVRLRGVLAGPAHPPSFDLAILTAALLVATLLGGALTAAALLAGRRTGRGRIPLALGALAAAVWATATAVLIAATEAKDLGFGAGRVAAGAVLAGVATHLAGHRRAAALAAAIVLAAAGSLPAVRLRPPQPSPPPAPTATLPRDAPGVVVVMIDTWRWDATDLAAGGLGTTPLLAELAADGSTVFPAAAAPAPSTLPTVKALITGRPASHFGILGWGNQPPPAETWTLARAFRAAGWATTGFTANAIVREQGFESGFESYWAVSGLASLRRSFFLDGLLARGHYWRIVALSNVLELHKTRGDSVVDGFEGWLDRHAGEGPFFAYLHIVEPHSPYHDRGYGLIPEAVRDLPQRYTHDLLRQLPIGDPDNARLRETPAMDEIVGRYREEVRDADRLLGRIVGGLRQRGLYDDTLLVVVGDHGEEFLEHNGFGHGHDVFEELVHVPLVMRWPRREPFRDLPASFPDAVSLLDVFPTLADFLELPPAPEPFVGRSLRPALTGAGEARGVIAEAVFRHQVHLSYRLGSLKARCVFGDPRRLPSESGAFEVFDLAADPGETAPLAAEDRRVVEFLERARPELDAFWDGARKATVRGLRPPPEDTEEDDEALERLRALGYLN